MRVDVFMGYSENPMPPPMEEEEEKKKKRQSLLRRGDDSEGSFIASNRPLTLAYAVRSVSARYITDAFVFRACSSTSSSFTCEEVVSVDLCLYSEQIYKGDALLHGHQWWTGKPRWLGNRS
ncbi:Os08g0416033 [Oryza sativa Japonica Group]|uniref:Os08g0416033 protein n=1 Tax=Oryza sativa subsp. japonica TaxID=39947 RepID=A0A0P0XG71_ORYSJ|nr:Os08g0416033 [Oryza sativa Japonica Group]